jgi:hypothetical protein
VFCFLASCLRMHALVVVAVPSDGLVPFEVRTRTSEVEADGMMASTS